MRGHARAMWESWLKCALAGVIVIALLCAFEWPQRTTRILAELETTEDLVTRSDLIRLLAHRDDSGAEEALVALLADPRAEIRREATHGLKGRTSSPAQAALAATLTDSDPAVRVAAAEGLAASGSIDSVPALIRALGDPHAGARAAAASALGVVLSRPAQGELGDKAAMAPVAVALDDEAPEVRLAAARALTAMASTEAIPALMAKLHDPAPEVRVAVFELLAKLAPSQTEPLLMQALDESTASVQLELLRVLASLPAPMQAETLTRLDSLARKGRPQLAAAARLQLNPEPTLQSSPDWVALLEQTDRQDPQSSEPLLVALERALPQGENLAVDPLVIWLGRAPNRLRGRIAALIARAKPEISTRLLDLAKDRDPTVRRAVMRALGSCKDQAAVPALLAGLGDRHDDVALAAARALGGQCTAHTLSELRRRLARGRNRPLRREPWAQPSTPMAKRLMLGLVGCLERLPSNALDPRTRAELEQLLLLHFEAATEDAEQASLTARGLALFPSEKAFASMRRAYREASPPLRVALVRASVRHRSNAARELRKLAGNEQQPTVAATAKVAAWLAGDPGNTPPEVALGERAGRDLVWPLGPIQAFLLASNLKRSPATAQQAQALCAALVSPEPITRANAQAGQAPAGSPGAHCSAPFRSLARGRASTQAPPYSARSPDLKEANSSDSEPRWWEPGAFRALVMADGRILVSAADAAGAVSWPDLREIVTENPWPGPYATE